MTKLAVDLRLVTLTSPCADGKSFLQTHTAIIAKASNMGAQIRLKSNPFFRLPDVVWTVATVGIPIPGSGLETSALRVWWSEVVGYELGDAYDSIAARMAEAKALRKSRQKPPPEMPGEAI